MIGVAIYSILSNDTDVKALVTAKIYPMQVKEDDSAPYITYQAISNVPSPTKQTASKLDWYRVQVSCFATRYENAVLLAKKVRDALDNHALESYTNDTHTIKVTSIKFDGEINLGIDSANLFEVAQDYIVTAYISARTFDDWFLPSKDLLTAMQTNLHAEEVGNFSNGHYWSSSENIAATAWSLEFAIYKVPSTRSKANELYVRACRSFTSTEGTYELEDIGPTGGLICYIDGTTFYEAAPSDQSISQAWSNITDVKINTTSTDVDESGNNTDAIIAQDGHTDSAAKLCNDLSI